MVSVTETVSAPSGPLTGDIIRETYPLIPPFAFAQIVENSKTGEIKYLVQEVPLTKQEEKALDQIKDLLIAELDIDFNVLYNRGEEHLKQYMKSKMIQIIKDYGIKLDDKALDKVFYKIERDFIGFGPIEPLLRDPRIEEISCDGVGIPIYVWHRDYESIPTNIKFDEDEDLDSFVIKIAQRANRHISVARPLLDASLPDGSRVQLTFGREVTQRGSTFTIRKFRSDPMTVVDLIKNGTLNEDLAAYFWMNIEYRSSILIGGGTAAGKTTLLNALAMFIKPGLKIVSIEDTRELNFAHDNWIQSVAREGYGEMEVDGRRRGEISLFDLLRAALRQRPDYLFVGEVRGEEAYTMAQAIATGHSSMATIHGDTVAGIIRRLESKPMNIPRQMIALIDIISVIRKVRTGNKFARRIVELQEIVGIDSVTNNLHLNKVFAWDPSTDNFTYFGKSYRLEQIMHYSGMQSLEEVEKELENRKRVLIWMVRKGISNYKEVTRWIREYYQDPAGMMARVRADLKTG